MSMTQQAFLSLLAAGLASLLAGLGLIRWHWDPSVPPFGRGAPLLRVLMRPSAYVRNAPLAVIGALNAIGVLLLAAAVAVAIYEILRVMHVA